MSSPPAADQGLHAAEDCRALSLSLLDWPGCGGSASVLLHPHPDDWQPLRLPLRSLFLRGQVPGCGESGLGMRAGLPSFLTSPFFSLFSWIFFFSCGTKTEYFSWGKWLQVGSFIQDWNKIKQCQGRFRLGTGRISSQKRWLGLGGAVQGGAGVSVSGII